MPSFLNQRAKSQDAEAKSLARTAQTAAETYFIDNQSYNGMSWTVLEGMEPALNAAARAPGGGVPAAFSVDGTGKGYRIYVYSLSEPRPAGDAWFDINKDPSTGQVSRSCSRPGKGGCPSNSRW